MAKGRVVDNMVRLLIAEVHHQHPDWPAKMVQAEANKRLGQDWPGLSVVQKELSKIKERLMVDNPQEKPWSIASLDSCPISPDALPVVLKVWKSRVEKDSNLTNREAKWVSRLSCVVSDIEKLADTARRYALVELLYETAGHPFNSRALDKTLMDMQFDDFDPLEPKVSDLPLYLDKDGEFINFTSSDAIERFQAKRKGGTQ